MPYIIILALVVLLLFIFYYSPKDCRDDINLLEEVPNVNLSVEELEKRALEISTGFTYTKKTNCRRKIMRSLDISFGYILDAHQYIDKEVNNKRDILPAGEWLLDNIYLIEKEYKDVKYNMPKSYYYDLPVIKKGLMKGFPRIYFLAVELVAGTDARIEGPLVETFVNAYQKNTILTSSELWALPIMLRIAILQNIGKVAQRLIFAQREKKKGDALGERLSRAYHEERLDKELSIFKDENVSFNPHFTERFLRVLRDSGVDHPGLDAYISEKLDYQEKDAEKMIMIDHQRQISFQLSIGNSINSIREIEALSWRESFERLSYIEAILNEDPANVYPKMEFESRDYYRHKVERLAKSSKTAESFVAKKALECAQVAKEKRNTSDAADGAERKHIGYYLVDDGTGILKNKLKYKKSIWDALYEIVKNAPVTYYLDTIVLLTLLLMGAVLLTSYNSDSFPRLWRYIIAALVILVPCSEIVISIFHWNINRLSLPRYVPKLDLKEGIPKESSAVVVIPTLLNNPERVHQLFSDMEVYYLANQEKNLYFALLGDFKDSTRENEDGDQAILETALREVKLLNEKYTREGEEIFFFMNRYRLYNEKQEIWLGWERKRGKLMEFTSFMRGNDHTTYNTFSDGVERLRQVKYVITLDADTELPRDSAKRLVGAMEHILNLPVIDTAKKKVVRGYGLMQPRVSISTLSANKSFFSKIFSGETGIDVYTTAVSDVYQDLFGEGIFTGKGIFNVDVFYEMLKDQIPENSILSHDLLEGSYVRTALVTDIELIDGYPACYNSSSMRLHRWVRGDWQLLPWLAKKSSLNTLSRWKIIDNLRRSLLAPSIIILILFSMGILPDGSDKWLIVAFLAVICPILFDVSEAVVSPINGISLSGKLNNTKNVIEQAFIIFSFLPFQAYLMVDAITRTLYRLLISKKNLLEWQTAADVEAKLGRKLKNFISLMWVGSLIALIVLFLAFYRSTDLGILMFPTCAIWFVSPYMAYAISREIKKSEVALTQEQQKLLRKLSRKTWAYFEDFVNEEEHWLAPDNFQVSPPNGLAHRTSPTNIGMGIATNMVAYDLGYIGIVELVERLDKIISSIETLGKYKGHFYNWYNTENCEPLFPRYISTVDSGNLAGYLWVVAQALEDYLKKPVLRKACLDGLSDNIILANEELSGELKIAGDYSKELDQIKSADLDINSWKKILTDLWGKTIDIDRSKKDENLYWNNKLKQYISRSLGEAQKLFPWADIIIERPENTKEVTIQLKKLCCCVSFGELAIGIDSLQQELSRVDGKDKKTKEWLESLNQLLDNSKSDVLKLYQRITDLKQRMLKMTAEMDFSFLYDQGRQLFSIGYNIEDDSLGRSYYDLLASESRQASFIAIAKGEIEQKHWFKLGRSMTLMGRSKGLVSWSGTMFEYFMPLLIMKNYPDSLLNETYRAVIQGQKKYCRDRKVPWGISESAFHNFDINLNYQYKAFGVPGIGVKRGLVDELVVSPYSTILALQIDLQGALINIQELVSEGTEGRYGLYEAVDYTKDRLPKGRRSAVIQCFMVHHQGMSLLALDNVLHDNILQQRFHEIPQVKATELLLQERVPKRVVYDREQQFELSESAAEKQNIIMRSYQTPKTETPEAHLLSNCAYSLMVTNRGSGFSKIDNMMVYRWREDPTSDNTGMFCYVKNLNSNEYWSTTYEPCKCEGEEYKVTFSLDKIDFKRKDGNLHTHTEIAVPSEDNAEIRKITIANHSEHTRIVEVTSYCEVTLAPYAADIVHPSFSNLFIQTEFVEQPLCILASRRPRAKGQKKPWLMQTMAVEGDGIGAVQYETSRVHFIGRGRTLVSPVALENDTPLHNTVGAVLDPIISMRRRVEIGPGKTCSIAFTTGVCYSREDALEMAKKYKEMQNIDRVFELAWTQIQVEMNYLGVKSAQANLYQIMASKIFFINPLTRDREAYIKEIKRGQSSLWKYGISGDMPVVLLIVREDKDVLLARQVLTAHEYWSLKGLKVDLVILNLQVGIYTQPLQNAVRDFIAASYARDKQNASGGVFLYSKDTMERDDIELLIAIARLVLDSEKGQLITQLKEGTNTSHKGEALQAREANYVIPSFNFEKQNLSFYNDIGGFNTEHNHYTILLKNYRTTPAPWINVISNSKFGFHVSENGVSYTWYKNSRENKLTAWSNDWVTDRITEAVYIRDEYTGKVWGISPKPGRDEGEYIIEHGFGYTTFKHYAQGIVGEKTLFIPVNESIKLCLICLRNETNVERELSATFYARTTLGVVSEQTMPYISTYINEEKGYIYARNPYSEHFREQHVYLGTTGGSATTFTGNRTEFLGKGGSEETPEGLTYRFFSNTCGAGYDPCLVLNTKVNLKPGEEKTVIIFLGAEDSIQEVNQTVEKYKDLNNVLQALEEVKAYWMKLLQKLKVKTPDQSMDLLLNGWLLYQTIVCRIWSRTAFYQSGGAYGFRDQLQDVMAACYVKPEMTKAQILHSASRQFLEGDVQHWWHPYVDSGIRTRFSDDLLWLPYVTVDYISNTGDYGILDEKVTFLEDAPLQEGEDERYSISKQSEEKGTIYDHCIRAIERGLKFGIHNIPLMGSGDWNDGMSTVGNEGRGESVWLGWFLYDILDHFVPLCKRKQDDEKVERYTGMKRFIEDNLDKNAWDGSWYRRAYFDDGTPLGSAENDECQIDSLSQSWSVISGAGKSNRTEIAMEALERHLIREDKGLVMLLTPAFYNSKLEPGYIKGYVPGVRENGGQYTHASIWVILALAKMGKGDKAWKVFNMINPINHSRSYLECERYKVEPYVMTADVYAVEPHTGRGGWSWYTGAAGWMYRVGAEWILGFKLKEGKGFTIEPNIPSDWNNYEMEYSHEEAIYHIQVKRGTERNVLMNGLKVEDGVIPLLNQGIYEVEVYIV